MNERCCILAVHGHPDDETIHVGGTLARYAAAGARVVCATATRGELGEIVDSSLASDTNYGRLGELRMDEMAAALACLGRIESRWLGYRDSGMAGDRHNSDPEAFCQADPIEAAGRIARVIREVRPQVVLTHRQDGGDGHPDHRQAARVTGLAFERAGDPDAWPDQLVGQDSLEPWTPSKLYEEHSQTRTQLDRREKLRYLLRDGGLIAALPVLAQAVLRLRPGRRAAQHPGPALGAEARQHPVTTRIAVAPWVAARDAAIRAYRTQVAPSDPLLELRPEVQRLLSPTENYTLRAGPNASAAEDDLFAGLDCMIGEAASSSGAGTPSSANG